MVSEKCLDFQCNKGSSPSFVSNIELKFIWDKVLLIKELPTGFFLGNFVTL